MDADNMEQLLAPKVKEMAQKALEPVRVWRTNQNQRLESSLMPLSARQQAEVTTWLRGFTDWLKNSQSETPPPTLDYQVQGLSRKLEVPNKIQRELATGERAVLDWLEVDFQNVTLPYPTEVFLEEVDSLDEDSKPVNPPVIISLTLDDLNANTIWQNLLLSVSRKYLSPVCGCDLSAQNEQAILEEQTHLLRLFNSPLRNIKRLVFYTRPLSDNKSVSPSEKRLIKKFLNENRKILVAYSQALCFERRDDSRNECSSHFVALFTREPELSE